MKILAIDDQPMTLAAITHKLEGENYNVFTGVNGDEAIEKFNEISPDLLILDINMPGKSGFEVLQYIRDFKKANTPIILMSGENEEQSIVKAFNLGANEYIRKPVGLDELLMRVRKSLNQPMLSSINQVKGAESKKIQNDIVGVIIPCYNEADRLRKKVFQDFVDSNLGYHLCFVNDGSKDNTLEVLQELTKGREDRISVYDCPKNGGKAEAVRLGILHMIEDKQLDYVGYLDADLSTNFLDFDDLVKTISNSEFQIVGGSRMARMGADIHKEGSRAIISKTINLIIRKILGMSFNDTQCGAKVMTREVAENMFQKKFLTSWLFDVEIFLRMKKFYGSEKAISYICEQPLKRWVHEDGSKLSMKDSIKIVGQLFQLAVYYR